MLPLSAAPNQVICASARMNLRADQRPDLPMTARYQDRPDYPPAGHFRLRPRTALPGRTNERHPLPARIGRGIQPLVQRAAAPATRWPGGIRAHIGVKPRQPAFRRFRGKRSAQSFTSRLRGNALTCRIPRVCEGQSVWRSAVAAAGGTARARVSARRSASGSRYRPAMCRTRSAALAHRRDLCAE
jgi:hypothetical protein